MVILNYSQDVFRKAPNSKNHCDLSFKESQISPAPARSPGSLFSACNREETLVSFVPVQGNVVLYVNLVVYLFFIHGVLHLVF